MNWTETKTQLEKYGIKNLPDKWHYRIDLSYADLSNANLRYTNLRHAYLSNANLSNANLSYADLSNTNFSGADLRYADLRGADLRYADLSNTNLSNTDLSNADLSNADLSNADLSGANLSNTDLSDANLPIYQKWYVIWRTNGTVKIGCKQKTIADWDEWFAGNRTFETERNTADFERIEAAYQHAKRMYEIWLKYEGK